MATISPKNLFEALEFYYQEIEASRSLNQAKNIKHETDSSLVRFILSELRFQREDPLRRMTAAEIEAAHAFMKTVSIRFLPKLLQLAEKAFERLHTSKSVRNTYGARIQQFQASCAEQPWYPGYRTQNPKFKDECSLPLLRQYGRTSETLLIPEKRGVTVSAYYNYSLKPDEISAQLQEELDEFVKFIGDKHYVDRVIAPIALEGVAAHEYAIRLILGWWHRYYNPALPLEKLSLNLLVPKITNEVLEPMSEPERKRFWREQKRSLKSWVLAYFEFQEDKLKSRSPRTREVKLAKIAKVAYFQYAAEVEEIRDYDQMPLVGTIKELQRTYRKEVREWTQNRRYAADQSQKWPDIPEGKTALTVLKEGLFEKIRCRCRQRNSSGVFHAARPLAQFHATFLMWADVLLEPPRRQQEARSRRVALSCPIKRPVSVPANGVYHPLPPDEVRERDRDGVIADNYLYRVYERNGVYYPEGIWVKQICQYKTRKYHGPQDIIIRNQSLGEGLTLYDYIERYLYGWWHLGNFRDSNTYSWWDEALQGRRGRWLTKGVMEFESPCHLVTDPRAGDWAWTLLFPCPKTGNAHTTDSLSRLFAVSSHEWLGRRITPHVLRHVWATWAFQVGLADAEIHSLAYAMGTTYETLKKWYQRCTPDDKRRLIEEVIDDHFLDVMGQMMGDEQPNSLELRRVLNLAQKLSPEERQRLCLSLSLR